MLGDFSYKEAEKAAAEAAERCQRGEQIETFRVVETNDYTGREEEWPGLSLGEAALRMDEQTGVGADLVLADFDEDCTRCEGQGTDPDRRGATSASPCTACLGVRKRRDPWEFCDSETGREIVLMRETER